MHLKDGAEFAQGLPTGWVDMETLTSRANRDLWPAWNWLSWHVFKRQQTTPTGRRIKTIDARALPPLRSCLRSACRFPMTGGLETQNQSQCCGLASLFSSTSQDAQKLPAPTWLSTWM